MGQIKTLSVYTENNLPSVPDEIGGWIRMDRVAEEGSRTTWRVTYENAVGGSVGYRFNTKRAANAYHAKLRDASRAQGNSI